MLTVLLIIDVASFYVIRGQSYVVVKITNNEITDLIMTTQVSYIKLLIQVKLSAALFGLRYIVVTTSRLLLISNSIITPTFSNALILKYSYLDFSS